MRGSIITIEGSDGSGKKTQATLLYKRAKKEGYRVKLISFPNYRSFWGKLIAKYLKGEFGKIEEIDPRDSSMLYALDRFSSKGKIMKILNSGTNIIFDRYIESNCGHQGAKYRGKKREELIKWIYDIELKKFGMPKSDIVIYLDLPPKYAIEAMKKRKRKYLKKGEKDIHESDIEHLKEAYKTYSMLAKRMRNWKIVKCVDENGKRISRKDF